MDLTHLALKLYAYLKQKGINFNDEGYPIFSREMLLNDAPKYVLPIGHTSVKDKKNALLVFFSNDQNIYKRLLRLEQDLSFYKQFYGVSGFDLSPRINWNVRLQKFNILLSMMATAYLAVNGIKVMPNFRTGCIQTLPVLNCYPANSTYIAGTIGCSRGYIDINEMHLRFKLILSNPRQLIFYGTLKEQYSKLLKEFGIKHKCYLDFNRYSRKWGSTKWQTQKQIIQDW